MLAVKRNDNATKLAIVHIKLPVALALERRASS